MQTFDIFGKKYQIQSGLNSGETEKINGDVVKRLKILAIEYPSLDRMDILILYVIELKEKIRDMEKSFKKESDKLEKTRDKVVSLEKKIVEELKNLDKI